jgi:hypothetical protein
MKKGYLYIYYRAYDFLTIIGSYDIYFAAVHLLSLIEGFLLIDIVLRISLLKTLLKSFSEHNYLFVLFYFVPLAFNYYCFMRRKRYLEIILLFKNESSSTRTVGRITIVLIILLLLYFLITS